MTSPKILIKKVHPNYRVSVLIGNDLHYIDLVNKKILK